MKLRIKEIYTSHICLTCDVRRIKAKELEEGNGKIKDCRCTKSKYYAWVVDSVMEGKNE